MSISAPCLSRRELLRRGGMGFGSLALGTLLTTANRATGTENALAPRAPHFAPRQNASSTCS